MSKVCQVYQLSPLWKFESTPQALKTYSEQLTGLLGSVSTPTPGGGGNQRKPYVGVVRVKDFGLYCVEVVVRRKGSPQGTYVA